MPSFYANETLCGWQNQEEKPRMERIQKLQQEESFYSAYLVRGLSVKYSRDKRLKYGRMQNAIDSVDEADEATCTHFIQRLLLMCIVLFYFRLLFAFFFSGAKLLIPYSQYFCSVFNSHQFTLRILKFIQLYTIFFSLRCCCAIFLKLWIHRMLIHANGMAHNAHIP